MVSELRGLIPGVWQERRPRKKERKRPVVLQERKKERKKVSKERKRPRPCKLGTGSLHQRRPWPETEGRSKRHALVVSLVEQEDIKARRLQHKYGGIESVSVVLEVAFNEMASGKVEKRDGSKEGVHDYDRISRDRERHQDYGGECWVILMVMSWFGSVDHWYPNMTLEMFAKCCPVCQDNCNCKCCLRDVLPKVKEKVNFEPSTDQKIQHSMYIMHVLLPFLKRLNEEHIKEKQIEAKIQGCRLSELQVKRTKCSLGERMYWNFLILSPHEEVVIQFEDPGSKYLFGGPLEDVKRLTRSSASAAPKDHDSMSAADPAPKELETHDRPSAADSSAKEEESHDWMSLDGRIPCPLQSMGGCGNGILELIHAKEQEHASELLASAQELLEKHRPDEDIRDLPKEWCTCLDFVCESDDKQLRKAASRENSNDNYLYCPHAIDIQAGHLKHFQWH
nr:hypothetical protein [Tanacetum cinerariifolium]